MDVGKCPKCENMLASNEIYDFKFRGTFEVHVAYVCRICGFIIGFSRAK